MRQPVSTLAETVLRLEPVEARIRSLGVESLALFGSVLRGAPDASSDVDLLVRFSSGKKNLDHFFRLADLLEERLGRRVELITTEALSPILGPKILAEAQDVLQAA
ncbi:MAG TPA: nucleotidyltransferase domain-containing protein [Trueperaceae bacterium]|nr:nucleotidyltransferase domain-containing protein [Trueperaceae bacterium]